MQTAKKIEAKNCGLPVWNVLHRLFELHDSSDFAFSPTRIVILQETIPQFLIHTLKNDNFVCRFLACVCLAYFNILLLYHGNHCRG